MAEAVIGSIAEKIIEILGSQAIEIVGKLRGINRELEALKRTVSLLQPVLDDAEEQYRHPHIRIWVEQLKDAFYEAQDVLEEFNIEAMRREQRGHNEMMKAVRTFFSSSNQLAFKLKMSDKVRVVRVRIDALVAIIPALKVHPKKELRSREETYSFIREEDIKGREYDKQRVMEFLLDSNMEENVSILPIIGIGGLGKTTLAKYVYGDSNFDLKMWVCVSTNFDMKKIAKEMLACAKGKGPTLDAMELLQSELRANIDKKKYLLVLDDVWSIDLQTWLNFKTLLVGGARGSKILITTRNSSIAEITGTAKPHFLKRLSESASVELLMQMAGRKIEEIQDSDMLAIVEEIVRKCRGVPLLVLTIGSLLRQKSNLEWLNFKLPEVSQMNDDIISVLRLSYDHLPSHLKQCFAFCSLFPKDYEMDKQTLVNLWVAEGFIQSNRSEHLEDIAHGYFMDLLSNNFFHDYKKHPFNEGTCKMHGLMHDLACLVAGNECLAAWDGTKSIHERTRHISYCSTFNLMDRLPTSRLEASALRTFLPTTRYWEKREQKEPTSEADLGQLILNFKRLRILDLHGENVEKVPRSIYKLKHITYLDISYNRTLKRLPNSITRLPSLQTLNLHRCDALEELPSDIRKLVSLRNLDISGCHKLSYLPRGIGELRCLHKLTHFVLPKDRAHAKNYCRLGELKGLNNIRGRLSIKNLRYVTNAEVECKDANLMGKCSLESLDLIWSNFNIDDVVIANRDEALLDGLKPPSNLQKLTIKNYKGESFSKWMMDSLVYFLPRLVDISFHNCKRCKCLPPLDQLPCLKFLYIKYLPELEYIQSSPSTTSFLSLLKLMIVGCEKLEAMPRTPHLEELHLIHANGALLINQMMLGLEKLKRLDIYYTKFSECLPEEGFQRLTSLESLQIRGCHQLTSLWQGMRYLSSLVDLLIEECEELDISKDESGNILDFYGSLQTLRSVEIFHLPKLSSLPQWLLQARNLECLKIWHCDNLKDIPEQIEALQSLQRLEIVRSPLLTSLPEGMRTLTSLTYLQIVDCGELGERCKGLTSEDCDKIAHIPSIRFEL